MREVEEFIASPFAGALFFALGAALALGISYEALKRWNLPQALVYLWIVLIDALTLLRPYHPLLALLLSLFFLQSIGFLAYVAWRRRKEGKLLWNWEEFLEQNFWYQLWKRRKEMKS